MFSVFLLQHFISNDTAELYKVKYNPYPTAHAPGGLFKTDEAQGAGNRFEEQQSKFLDCGEGQKLFLEFCILDLQTKISSVIQVLTNELRKSRRNSLSIIYVSYCCLHEIVRAKRPVFHRILQHRNAICVG